MMVKIKTIHFMIETNDEITPINLMVVDSSGIILKLSYYKYPEFLKGTYWVIFLFSRYCKICCTNKMLQPE